MAQVTFKLSELDELIGNQDSGVTLIPQCVRYLVLSPFQLQDLKNCIRINLYSSVAKYDTQLDGIILSYKRIKIEDFFSIQDDGKSKFRYTADIYVFKPKTGNVLSGIVNKKGSDHISCLVHRVFNVAVPRPDNLNDDELWIGSKLKIGQEVLFKVVDVDLNEDMPYIKGELIDQTGLIYDEDDDYKDETEDVLDNVIEDENNEESSHKNIFKSSPDKNKSKTIKDYLNSTRKQRNSLNEVKNSESNQNIKTHQLESSFNSGLSTATNMAKKYQKQSKLISNTLNDMYMKSSKLNEIKKSKDKKFDKEDLVDNLQNNNSTSNLILENKDNNVSHDNDIDENLSYKIKRKKKKKDKKYETSVENADSLENINVSETAGESSYDLSHDGDVLSSLSDEITKNKKKKKHRRSSKCEDEIYPENNSSLSRNTSENEFKSASKKNYAEDVRLDRMNLNMSNALHDKESSMNYDSSSDHIEELQQLKQTVSNIFADSIKLKSKENSFDKFDKISKKHKYKKNESLTDVEDVDYQNNEETDFQGDNDNVDNCHSIKYSLTDVEYSKTDDEYKSRKKKKKKNKDDRRSGCVSDSEYVETLKKKKKKKEKSKSLDNSVNGFQNYDYNYSSTAGDYTVGSVTDAELLLEESRKKKKSKKSVGLDSLNDSNIIHSKNNSSYLYEENTPGSFADSKGSKIKKNKSKRHSAPEAIKQNLFDEAFKNFSHYSNDSLSNTINTSDDIRSRKKNKKHSKEKKMSVENENGHSFSKDVLSSLTDRECIKIKKKDRSKRYSDFDAVRQHLINEAFKNVGNYSYDSQSINKPEDFHSGKKNKKNSKEKRKSSLSYDEIEGSYLSKEDIPDFVTNTDSFKVKKKDKSKRHSDLDITKQNFLEKSFRNVNNHSNVSAINILPSCDEPDYKNKNKRRSKEKDTSSKKYEEINSFHEAHLASPIENNSVEAFASMKNSKRSYCEGSYEQTDSSPPKKKKKKRSTDRDFSDIQNELLINEIKNVQSNKSSDLLEQDYDESPHKTPKKKKHKKHRDEILETNLISNSKMLDENRNDVSTDFSTDNKKNRSKHRKRKSLEYN